VVLIEGVVKVHRHITGTSFGMNQTSSSTFIPVSGARLSLRASSTCGHRSREGAGETRFDPLQHSH
jgi:hypothetical protein